MTTINPVKKLLCIETDRAFLGAVQNYLKSSYEPGVVEYHETSSSEEGLRLIHVIRPEIILCGMNLPGADGFEVCRQVREMGLAAAVVLVSDYDPEGDPAEQAQEAGADGYLAKPLKKGEFRFTINAILRMANLSGGLSSKNLQIEKAQDQHKLLNQKLSFVNDELQNEKKRLSNHLQEMARLNAQLEAKNNQISFMNHELVRQFNSTVGLLANIIELNRSQHRGHSERVAEIAVFIAEKMRLSEHHVRNIKTAARLHELGIVSLPRDESIDEVLDEGRSRKYTNHPLVGEMLLKGFPGFEMIADIIRHMHENVDGTGQPDGLIGPQIPIGSRIVSVASYFDHALLANPGKKPGAIVKMVGKFSGTLFDEDVVGFLGEYVDHAHPEESIHTLECNVFSLKEGMELASDIYSESGINLLRKGTVLNKEILGKILKFHNLDPVAGGIKVKI